MTMKRILIAGAAVLAASGVLGMVPAAAQGSSASAPTWTQRRPASHPSARSGTAMAYDTATNTAVLFGGSTFGDRKVFAQTWTWNGSTWTKQTPATHPPARIFAAMAYDAATGTIVLFGGQNKTGLLGDTWTWNGSTWTKHTLATHPSARSETSMAYDAATGTIVLFGGFDQSGNLGDTWTWNGSTWAKHTPASSPPARSGAREHVRNRGIFP